MEVRRESSSATYPGSRKARLSGTARVPISSLGTSKAAGPTLSGGSLHGGRQGVSRRPSDQQCRDPSPFPPPTHLWTCQTILTWETAVARSPLEGRGRRTGGESDWPRPNHTGSLGGLGSSIPPTPQPQLLGGRSDSPQDSEGLTARACPTGELRPSHAILGVAAEIRWAPCTPPRHRQ